MIGASMRLPIAVAALSLLSACTKDAPATADPSAESSAAPAAAAPSSAPAEQGPVVEDGTLRTDRETVGPFHEGMNAAAVVAELGEPNTKEPYTLLEATGEYVSSWGYPDADLVLTLASGNETGEGATVWGVECGASCSYPLPWGLAIGSTRAEVEAVYGDHHDTAATDEHTFVAGSVYGGSFYRFEDGRVVGIFIGPGAE